MRLLITFIVSVVAGLALAQDEFKHEQKIVALVEPFLTHHKLNRKAHILCRKLSAIAFYST